MNVSAINCTPIKPQVSFGNEPESERPVIDADYREVESNDKNPADILVLTEDINKNFVNSKELKTPIGAVVSVALAGLTAYATGSIAASGISRAFNFVTKKNLPLALEKGLKATSKTIKKASTSLINDNAGKIAKVKNIAGKVIGKTGEIAKNTYTKIAYRGVPEGADVAVKASKGFQNIMGLGAVATILPKALKTDENGDGVSDIMQRATNSYGKAKEQGNAYLNQINTINSLAEGLEAVSYLV